MYNFLEAGYGNIGMAIICGLGMVGTWLAGRKYQRLARQTDNMIGTKNKFLKQIKAKFENAYRVNRGVNNVDVFVEKNVSECRILGIPIQRMADLAGQAAGICVLAGAILALLSYWNNMEVRQVVLYASLGAIFGAVAVFFSHWIDAAGKKTKFLIALKDYFENFLVNRLSNVEQDERHLRSAREEFEEKIEENIEEKPADIDYLKQSLDRIASGREEAEPRRKRLKFTPEEERLIEEILREYFA